MYEAFEYTELNSISPEFEDVYQLFSADIPAEYMETADFLRERIRIYQNGPQTPEEKLLVQDGYTVHLIVAKDVQTKQVVGGIYGHYIAGTQGRGYGFVGYIAVDKEFRGKGISLRLIKELDARIFNDAHRLQSNSPVAQLFEIEEEGHEEIKRLVNRLGGYPLDIVYYQPPVREDAEPQEMMLYCRPYSKTPLTEEDARKTAFHRDEIDDMVRSLFLHEYARMETQGFNFEGKEYSEFKKSIDKRDSISFRLHSLKS